MKQFQNILVALDTRFDDHPSLHLAARIAQHNQAKIKIVDVVRDLSWIARAAMSDAGHMQEAFADEKSRKLEALAAGLREKGIEVSTKVLSGKTSVAIIQEVLSCQHDLVVRVSKGAHSQRTGFFGTTSMRLLRKCPCAVWLVHPDDPPRFKKVLVAIDPRPGDSVRDGLNDEMMELGSSIAGYENGEVHIAHAWDLFGSNMLKSRFDPGEFKDVEHTAEMRVSATLDKYLERYGLNHDSQRVHLVRDESGAGSAIVNLANRQQIDLVVMGTIARTGVSGVFMGNTAEQVLDRVQCPVLTLKPEGFRSPVEPS